MGVIDEIKDRLDIVEIIGAYVPLQKAGRNFKALCPFHNEKTPSFHVFPDNQRWHCFGACAEGGDVFTFVMKMEGWDFRTALEELARKAGVELQPRTPQQVEAEEESERLRAALTEAVLYYHHLLRHATEAGGARQYLARRGLSDETIERFQLGYSLPGWDRLRAYLLEKGFGLGELLRAGLVSERDDGTTYDRFRERLMIPIHDSRGRPVGFGARTLDPHGVPKYLNSPQSPIFDKGRTLFGLDHAREALRQQDQVVIVEGYMDVMQAHQTGFGNVVAQMGTALGEPQVRQLQKYTRRFVLALDPDAAGVQATLRGLQVTRDALDREWEPVFDPRGLVGFEGRLGAEIRVLSLPAGYDPDDLIREDPQAWQTLVDEALPVVEFYLQTLLRQADLQDAKERARIVEGMLPLLRDVTDPVERETYAQKVGQALGIETRTILEYLRSAERQSARRTPAAPARRAGPPRADLEGYCLAVLLAQPWLRDEVDHFLAHAGLPGLRAQDFVDPAYRTVFQTWQGGVEAGLPLLEGLRRSLPDQAGEQFERLAVAAQDNPAAMLSAGARTDTTRFQAEGRSLHGMAHEQWLEEGARAVLRLREHHLRQNEAELRMLVQEAQQAGKADAAEYGRTLAENARGILQIQQLLRTRAWIAASPPSGISGHGEGTR